MKTSEEKSEAFELLPEEKVDQVILLQELAGLAEPQNILRIEEVKFHKWSGVRSCGDTNRVASEVNFALEDWAKAKIFENRHLRYIRYSHLGGNYTIRNSNGGVSGRKCSGSLNLKCFIEFFRN